MRAGLATVGVLSTAGQVLLLRELAATFYGNELVYGIALAIWLLWAAAGAAVAARLMARTVRPSRGVFGAALVAAASLVGCQLVVLRGLRLWLGFTPGAIPSLTTILAASLVVLAPLCLVGGALFTVGSRAWVGARPAEPELAVIGRAYAWESAGSVVAGLAVSLLLLRFLAPLSIVLCLVTLATLTSSRLLGSARPLGGPGGGGERPSAGALALAAIAIGCLAAALPVGSWLEARTLDWTWPDRVAVRDSPHGRLVVVARDSQRAFYADGRLLFETQSTQPEEAAHVPLLVHPHPRRVLLIGGGVDGTLAEILKHPVDRVTYAELDPWLIQLARRELPAEQAAVLDDERVELRLTDGRRALAETQRPLDVIIVHLPEPATGQLNRFYSREFFAEAQAALAPDGLLAFGLPSAESYWNPALQHRNASILRALQEVFGSVVITAGDTNTFLASPAPLHLDVASLTERLVQRHVATRWLTPPRLQYLLDARRLAAVRQRIGDGANVPANRDSRPVSYFYEMALWLFRAGGRPIALPVFSGRSSLLLLAPALLFVWLALRPSPGGRIAVAVATAGGSVMALEVIVLLAYQSGHGALYQQIGLLLASFMAGMALGAARPPAASWTWLARLQLGLAVAGLAALGLGYRPATVSPFFFGGVGVVTGVLGGALFAVATSLARGSVTSIAGRLYAVDLVGAATGALLPSLVLVPRFGIAASCLLVVLGNSILAAAPAVRSGGSLGR